MQKILRKVAWLVQITMGTTAAESVNACGCVFLGQVLYLNLFYFEKNLKSTFHCKLFL